MLTSNSDSFELNLTPLNLLADALMLEFKTGFLVVLDEVVAVREVSIAGFAEEFVGEKEESGSLVEVERKDKGLLADRCVGKLEDDDRSTS